MIQDLSGSWGIKGTGESTLVTDSHPKICLDKVFDEAFPADRIIKSTADFQLQALTHAENLRKLFRYHREQM